MPPPSGRDVHDALIASVDIYDTTTGVWSTSPSNWPAPKSDLGGFAYDQDLSVAKIYLAGGYDAGYSSYRTIDTFDPVSNVWHVYPLGAIPNMIRDRGDFAFVELKGKWYAYGGWSSQDFTSPLVAGEVFDPATNTWSSLPDLREGRGDKVRSEREKAS